MTPSNSVRAGYELVTLDRDHGPYAAGSRWAEPDVGHARGLLRRVIRHPDLGPALGTHPVHEVAAAFGAKRCGRIVLDRSRRLAPDLEFAEER